jgi:hypothetical protein
MTNSIIFRSLSLIDKGNVIRDIIYVLCPPTGMSLYSIFQKALPPFPSQRNREIIEYIRPHVEYEPGKFGYTREELQMFKDICNRLVHLAAGCHKL